jgi:hypothetical protein
MALTAEEPLSSATMTALEEAVTFAAYRDEFDQVRKRHPGRDYFSRGRSAKRWP